MMRGGLVRLLGAVGAAARGQTVVQSGAKSAHNGISRVLRWKVRTMQRARLEVLRHAARTVVYNYQRVLESYCALHRAHKQTVIY